MRPYHDPKSKPLERSTRKRALLQSFHDLLGFLPHISSDAIEADRALGMLLQELEAHQLEIETQNLQLQESQQLLEESRNRYANLYDFAPVAYLTHDRAGVIKEINLTGAQLLKKERSSILGLPLSCWVSSEHKKTLFDHLSRCRSFRTTSVMSEITLRPFGHDFDEPIHVQMQSIPEIGTDSKTTSNFLAVLTDITALKITQIELTKAKELAEAASRSKNIFIANMSHEIRTPMAAVIGFADVLLGDDKLSSDEKLAHLHRIRRNGQQLLHLIDDVLDLSKAEAGKIRLNREPVAVRDWILDMASMFTSAMSEKGVAFRIGLEGWVPKFIQSDRIRLNQILTNLLANAVKFTERGEIEISLRLGGHGSKAPWLELDVRDTGIGIDPSAHAKLFEPFVQADSSVSRKFGGTGLGLTLSRKLARHMGGDLILKWSHPGKGSLFRIQVPTGDFEGEAIIDGFDLPVVSNPATQVNMNVPCLKNIRVLVVEDMTDNQVLLECYLRSTGARVEMAGDGLEGIEKAMAGHFDIVLMDIQMPRMDGITATLELRRRGFCQPILALTAHALREEQEKSREAGCDGHLTKPVNREDLIRSVEQACSVRPSPASLRAGSMNRR